MITAEPLVEPATLLRLDEGLVHSDVYASPAIFELEVERIFHRGWMYVGHASEIPTSGDYVLRWIGQQSVILSRGSDGRVRIFMNRCRHRGNSVCQFGAGNSAFFRCAYHGWTYKNTGELIGVPYDDAYDPPLNKPEFGLVEAPRMAEYRGFVWGSLASDGMSLDEYLGIAGKHAIDLFCDHSPSGTISVRHGSNKSRIYANWKFQGGDGYHPPFTHQAMVGAIRAKREGRPNPLLIGDKVGVMSRDLGNGHFCLDVRGAGLVKLPNEPWAHSYRASMIESYGQERADYIIASGGPHTIFMPNVQLLNPDVRVLRPVAVDEVEITFSCAFLDGVPNELNTWRLRQTESRMGPAGSVNVDDVEMFERNQFGLQQATDPWSYIGRGTNREFDDDDDCAPEAYRMRHTRVAHYSDELTQRAQLRWWASELSRP